MNSALRRRNEMNDTALERVWALVSGKIKCFRIRSHFGLEIDSLLPQGWVIPHWTRGEFFYAMSSALRRRNEINDTALERVRALVSGKIKFFRIRSHFGLEIDRSSEQNESNSGVLSENWSGKWPNQRDSTNGTRQPPMTVNSHYVLFFSDRFILLNNFDKNQGRRQIN